jgi:hypothetical protein
VLEGELWMKFCTGGKSQYPVSLTVYKFHRPTFDLMTVDLPTVSDIEASASQNPNRGLLDSQVNRFGTCLQLETRARAAGCPGAGDGLIQATAMKQPGHECGVARSATRYA